MTAREIKRQRQQPQHARENKRRAYGRLRGQSHQQYQSRYGEAPAANTGQPDGKRDHRPDQEIHSEARFDSV